MAAARNSRKPSGRQEDGPNQITIKENLARLDGPRQRAALAASLSLKLMTLLRGFSCDAELGA